MHAEVLAFGKRFLNAGPTRLVYMALAASPLQRPFDMIEDDEAIA